MNFWLSAEVFSVSNKKERICFATGLLSLIKPYAYYGPVVFGIFQSAFSTVYYLEMISLASKKFTRGIWILLIPLINLMYLPLDRSNGHVFILVTAFDKIIPIERIFVLPYALWYLFIFFPLIWFMLIDYDLYKTAIISIVTGFLICFAIFFIYQTGVPRPVVAGQDFLSRLIRLIYHFDAPYNDFPSIHVMSSFIILLGCMRARTYSREISWLIQIMAVLVILSTLFIKQHTLLGMTGGLITGGVIYTVTYKAVDLLGPIDNMKQFGVSRVI